MADRIGQQLGNYRLVSLLGQGGYAEVYLGQHVRLDLQAAIKVLHTHLSAREAEHFQQEAQTIAKLAHPSIVRVFDFDVQEGVPFLVMDYAPNGSLRQHHPQGKMVPLALIVSYVKQLATALQYAHEHKLVHRDVKPENMLVGRNEEVLLSDFGIATVAHSTASLSAQLAVGTMAYMAPEQIQGHPRPASDQYALGIVVYEWLCGSRPFSGSFTELISQHLWQPPPSLLERVSAISPAVDQVVLRALAKDPKQRFASVQAFAAALEHASQDIPGLAWQFVSGPSLLAASALPSSATQAAQPSQVGLATEAMPPTSQDAGATQPEAELPWNVPFGRNPFFTGRSRLLERLHVQLSRRHRVLLNQSYALSGLGGIGKTQTAIEYAYRYREEYRAVFWVRADSRETLVADYVAIAQLLSLPGQDTQDQVLIVAAVKHWLELKEGWLLILDNADELALLADFLPSAGKGHVLLTTRAQATGKIAESLAVEKLEPSEGMQLLLRRAKVLAPETPLDAVSRAVHISAQSLVEELDGLPLALDQAGAYIEETGCSLSEYLALYQLCRLNLLKRQSSVSIDYPDTVASTWALSFQRVEQESRPATELLRLCAFLHPDAIPEEIITEGANELGSVLSPAVADPLLLNEAIQVLRRYSLVKRDPDARLLHLHRLVQVVLKEQMDEDMRRQWAERAVRAVNRAFPGGEFGAWQRCQQYLPHVQVCATLIEQWKMCYLEAAQLLNRAGNYLRERGRYREAEPLLKQALIISERNLGSEHPDVASSLNDLAKLYCDQGEFTQAEPLFLQALAIRQQVFGQEHPDVAQSLSDLAALYIMQGKYEQAESLLQGALAIRERVLGSDHPYTATSLNNLSVFYHDQGKFAEAELFCQQALTIRERTLGPQHPDVAISLNNLAWLHYIQGKYLQAESLCQRAFAIQEQVLGSEHPDVAFSLDTLAETYLAQGKWDQAELIAQQALAIREKALVTEHPDVVTSLNTLAEVYVAQGRYAEAEPLLQRVLTIREEKLETTHPEVAHCLHRLATLYQAQGKYERAEPLYQRALAIFEQRLGTEHPDTINVRKHYHELLQTMQE